MTAAPPPPAFTYGPLTVTDLVRYAGASGDFNPLHHDEAYARAAGLPTVAGYLDALDVLLPAFVVGFVVAIVVSVADRAGQRALAGMDAELRAAR